MHIPAASIAAMGICAVLGVAMFLGLLIFCKKRFGFLRPFWVGCGTFLVFAMVLETLMHQVVLLLFPNLPNTLWAFALYGGLAAGLFEETGRFVAMKWLRKKDDRDETAIVYGAGHGGIEVLLTLVSTMGAYLVYAILINAGQMEQITGSMDEANQAAFLATITQIAQSNPLSNLLGLVERVSAVILHISMSVLVWKAVKGELRWYPIAIAIHALFDIITVLLSRTGMNVIVLEVILLAFSLGTAYGARKVMHK